MQRFRFGAVAAFAVVAFVAACGGDSPTTPASNGNGNPPPSASVSSIDLSPTSGEVFLGSTTKLVATPRDASGNALTRAVSWTSSNASVADVDAAGIVSGRAVGTATISAESEGKSAAATITVRQAVAVATVTIDPSLDTIEAWTPATIQATLRDAGGNTLAGRMVRWATSNTAVATIDSVTGVLTGVDRGTVTVTATSEGKTGSTTRVIVIKYRSVSAGTMHACDIASGGIAWCWGLNGAEGRIGSEQMSSTAMSTTPFRVPGNHRFVQLATYGRHTCGITVEGRAYCWGSNSWGSLGGGLSASQSPTPVLVAGNATFRSITAGADHACAVTTANVAYCWGNGDWRQLGTGSSTYSSTPVAVAGGLSFATITAGSAFTCGVSSTNGAAYCWGANALGQTGDGQKINYGNVFVATPQAVVGGLAFKSVSLGSEYACGVTTTGQGYCWGSNNNGKLGAGQATIDSSTPVAVAGGLAFRSISAGFSHACGVTTSDAVYCWGANGSGQLGVTLASGSFVPVRAGDNLSAAEVSAAGIGTGSGAHTCAISADRLTAYCFRRNDVGQLGNGGTTLSTARNSTPSIVVGQKPL
jgi:alpha-tubulin suppressor-like RCC1 family protein